MRTTALLYARTLRHLRPWQVAGRLVASAKSWLCHGGVDREAPILREWEK